MARTVKTAAVLGAGVMGSGIAAHLANAGVRVHLLDIVPRAKDGSLPEDEAARNQLAAGAIAKALKTKPKAFASPERAALVTVGNLEDHLDRLKDVDWVIEAVIENVDIKRTLFKKLADYLPDHCALTSNTSGIPLDDLTAEMDEGLKKRTFITHFFNPPRYLRLVEVVSGPATDKELVEDIADFCTTRLGKGVVWAKDTPNFIANRIGVYAVQLAMNLLEEGYSIEEIDAVAGPPLAKPRSAVFRTADLVGLDTLIHVVKNCYDLLTEDPHRDAFKTPDFVKTMVEKGWTGNKGGQGFYKKTKVEGKRVILALDTNTLEYNEKQKVRFESTGKTRGQDDPAKRVKIMLEADDRGGEIARRLTLPTLCYAASLIPEIADTIQDVDNAMKWGFAWDIGPFECADAIGIDNLMGMLETAGIEPPEILTRVAKGAGTFYAQGEKGQNLVAVPATGVHTVLAPPKGSISLQAVKDTGGLVHKDVSASLLDLGEGVFCVEFHSKMNAVDDSIIKMLGEGVARAEKEGCGLVITNEAEHFSVGANLLLILMAAKQKAWDQLEQTVTSFQHANRGLRQAQVPVVAAPFGFTFGGGLEVCLGADAVMPHIECYHGLVEVGVGVIPGGGGCKEVLIRCLENVPAGVDVFPYVMHAFQSIGMAKVAESAEEGKALGYMRRSDNMVLNRDELTARAKQKVLGMYRAGYVPPPDPMVRVPGREGIANLTAGIQGMIWDGWISEHDGLIGRGLARILSGGDVASGTVVTEERLMELEMEVFLSLCGEEKSQARMEHMLTTNKPLRN